MLETRGANEVVEDEIPDVSLDRCAEAAYRLAVYQAGNALVARALGLRIIEVRLLPRPPQTITDKIFIHNNWDSFADVLETRVVELFGGQLAERMLCGSHTCCEGDISRIDELTRLLAGLSNDTDYEDVFFHLEDVAERIFRDQRVIDALPVLADVLYDHELRNEYEIPGPEIEAIIDRFLPPVRKRKRGLGSFFGLLRRR